MSHLEVEMLSYCSCVQLYVTQWNVACQAPLSIMKSNKNKCNYNSIQKIKYSGINLAKEVKDLQTEN